MKSYLVDTQIFLWSLFEPGKLSRRSRETMRNPDSHVFVSVITFWEIALKYSLGKLVLENVTPEEMPDYAEKMNLETIDVKAVEAASFARVPRLHKDPFDRMIIWQAIRNQMVLISRGAQISGYRAFGLKVIT